MGLDPKLVEELRERAPEVWTHALPALVPGPQAPPHTAGALWVVDLMTKLRRLPGPRPADPETRNCFTGEEFAFALFQLAFDKLTQGPFTTVVLCVDNQAFVPPTKHAEQKRRDNQRRRSDAPDDRPYSDDMHFCRRGIYCEAVGPESATPFRLSRVLASRGVRERLWAFIEQEWLRSRPQLPAGRELVWDRLSTEVLYLRGTAEGTELWRVRTPTNRFGESDLKVAYWVRRFTATPTTAHRAVLVHSIDRDLIPIFVHLLAHLHATFHGPIYQFMPAAPTAKERRPWVLDLRRLVDIVYDEWRWNSVRFGLFCILAGTDYVDRGEVFYRLGVPLLTQALTAVLNGEVHGLTAGQFERLHEARSDAMVAFVHFIYGLKWGIVKDQPYRIPAEGELLACGADAEDVVRASRLGVRGAPPARRARRICLPDQSDITTFRRAAAWNLGYWCRPWDRPEEAGLGPLLMAPASLGEAAECLQRNLYGECPPPLGLK